MLQLCKVILITNYQNKIVKESKIVNFSNYNKLFDELIIKRGDKLFKDGKIKQLKISNHKYSCTIEGTQVYSLFIEFDEYDNINNMECSCPYYEKGNNCKHLYTLLIEEKLKEKKIIEENQSKGLLSSILLGVIDGLNSPSPEKTKEDSIMKMAIEELEKGNSEPYIIEYNELDDDMFQDYE